VLTTPPHLRLRIVASRGQSIRHSERTASPVLKAVIERYMGQFGITLRPEYEADNLTSTMSLVASTGGVTVLPIYARNVLSSTVVLRPLKGEPPTIELFMAYNRSNTSPLLKRFLARADELVAAVARRTSSDL
jgi:LysR family transcriptional regulator, hca operon transcriptional activator